MKQKDWQWTVPPLCVQERAEEGGWKPPRTNSLACSTLSLPATSQVSNGMVEKHKDSYCSKDFKHLLMSRHFYQIIQC